MGFFFRVPNFIDVGLLAELQHLITHWQLQSFLSKYRSWQKHNHYNHWYSLSKVFFNIQQKYLKTEPVLFVFLNISNHKNLLYFQLNLKPN